MEVKKDPAYQKPRKIFEKPPAKTASLVPHRLKESTEFNPALVASRRSRPRPIPQALRQGLGKGPVRGPGNALPK
jgi:hypothetical protein